MAEETLPTELGRLAMDLNRAKNQMLDDGCGQLHGTDLDMADGLANMAG